MACERGDVESAGPPGPADRDLDGLTDELVRAGACWSPTMPADGSRIAYVSDRGGVPQLWVQEISSGSAGAVTPVPIPLGDDPVLAVHWSADGQWLACSVGTGGGVRTEVWVVRPDGSGARRLAGNPDHAVLGPWTRHGHRLAITMCGEEATSPNRCFLMDPLCSDHTLVTSDEFVEILDLSADERFALLRGGTRGAYQCRVWDRATNVTHTLLPYPRTGSTDLGMLRPGLASEELGVVAYLITDAGLPRRGLVAVPVGKDGERGQAGAIAWRPDAEVERADADDRGQRVLVVWNVEGRSEVEMLDARSGLRRCYPDLPGAVVDGAVLSRERPAGRGVRGRPAPSPPAVDARHG